MYDVLTRVYVSVNLYFKYYSIITVNEKTIYELNVLFSVTICLVQTITT